MKILGRLLTAILVSHFALYPQHGIAQSAPVNKDSPRKVTFSLVKQIVVDMHENPETYFSKEELSLKAKLLDGAVTSEVIADIKKKLTDNSYSLAEVKQQILSQLHSEQQSKLIELKYALSKIDSKKLDMFFRTALRDGFYDSELQWTYDSAYGQREKLEVLMQMLQSDMGMILTQNAKQIGLMSREELLKQVETTGSFMTIKNSDVKTVLIIVLTIAAAGLLTWGIVSATKTRYEKKTKRMHEEYDRKEEQAQRENEQKIKTLEQTFADRARLRDEGYTWQVCATTRTPKTSSCSYDYKSYSGEEVCVTNCLKSPAGIETHHVKTCLSAFIPNNCFVKNPTAAGYDDGYDSGYKEGYNVGYDRAYRKAYDKEYGHAYNNAYSSAYNSGYNSGYNAGFSAGYDDGYDANYVPKTGSLKSFSSVKALLGEPDERAEGFQKGFREGYAYALQLKVGLN